MLAVNFLAFYLLAQLLDLVPSVPSVPSGTQLLQGLL